MRKKSRACFWIDNLELRRLLSTIYVNVHAPIGENNGSSWTDAYTSLQQALGAAVPGVTIDVAQGIYYPTTPTGSGDGTATFSLEGGVAIDGGYAGNDYASVGASGPDDRNVSAYPTILSGDIVTPGGNSYYSYHVVTVSDPSLTSTLDGLTITGGYAYRANGGGLYNAGDLVVSDCSITGNAADNRGGGIYSAPGSTLMLDGSSVTADHANYSGGGVDAEDAAVTITDSTLSGDSALYGGAVYAYQNATIDINSSTLSGDSATGGGGAIQVHDYSSTISMANSQITGNSAAYGGAISNFGKLTITSSSITDNSASYDDAGINNQGWITITSSTISGNTSGGSGGGITSWSGKTYLYSSTVTGNIAEQGYGGGLNIQGGSVHVENTTITSNSASTGGGVYVNATTGADVTISNSAINGNNAQTGGGIADDYDTSLMLINSIISGNTATANGGGISNDHSSPTLINCTFSGNSAATGGAMDNSAASSPILVNCILWGDAGNEITDSPTSTLNITCSDIDQSGFAGGGNIDSDPQFIRAPGTNGAADYGDLHLQFTSPCIDAGNNTADLSNNITTDLDGNARIFDFPGANDSAGATVDMGAYELGYNLDEVIVPAGQTGTLPAGGYSFYANQLIIGAGDTLNVGDDALTIQYGSSNDPASAIASWTDSGFANGSWIGAGIISSTAASDASHATGVGYFDDGTQVTIRDTWYGDANANGIINTDDLCLILLGQAKNGTRWQDGNFNYDTQVNADDWIKLFYGLAYSKGQSLPTLQGDAATPLPNQAAIFTARLPDSSLSAFAQTPIDQNDRLSKLLDSPTLIL